MNEKQSDHSTILMIFTVSGCFPSPSHMNSTMRMSAQQNCDLSKKMMQSTRSISVIISSNQRMCSKNFFRMPNKIFSRLIEISKDFLTPMSFMKKKIMRDI